MYYGHVCSNTPISWHLVYTWCGLTNPWIITIPQFTPVLKCKLLVDSGVHCHRHSIGACNHQRDTPDCLHVKPEAWDEENDILCMMGNLCFHTKLFQLPHGHIWWLAEKHLLVSCIVMPRFGPEPKFEPEPLRTWPKSGSKFKNCLNRTWNQVLQCNITWTVTK